jgi:pSer/pThr/pTyr-binding forkhead associated (FHA) protein
MAAMSSTPAAGRELAVRVAKALVEKSRPEEAVALLSAHAAASADDADARLLLAEALRIDPAAKLARMAFERMQGVAADHAALDEAIALWTQEELTRTLRAMRPQTFRRAQVGFNNNLKYKSAGYHVQTEDSGLDKPHVITHLFGDGGRILGSFKRSYADAVDRPDIVLYVRTLMKGQQMEMVVALRDGRFDGVIEGRESSKLVVLEHPPDVDIRRLTGKRPAEKPAVSASAPAKVWGHLHVNRSLVGGPERYDLSGDELVLGTLGAIPLKGERFCHPREARLRWQGDRLTLEDFEGGNGVFLRVRTPVEVVVGDEFIIGDQLLRIQRNVDPDDGPDDAPTFFWSSPKWASSFRVVQIYEGGAEGACVLARGTTVQIGAEQGDLIFPGDLLVSEPHCVVEEQAGAIILTDLESRTGVFVRIRGEQPLIHGDELLIGRTRLQVDLNPLPPCPPLPEGRGG